MKEDSCNKGIKQVTQDETATRMRVCAYTMVLWGHASAWACVLIATGLSAQAPTTLPWSSCSTSPGSHRDVSVKALEQLYPACPEPAWQRISSVPYSVCSWVIQSWLTKVRTLPKGWSTEKTKPALNKLHHLSQWCLLLLAKSPFIALTISNMISEGLFFPKKFSFHLF